MGDDTDHDTVGDALVTLRDSPDVRAQSDAVNVLLWATRHQIRRYAVRCGGHDETCQVAAVELYLAASAYDATRPGTPYARTVVGRRLRTLAERANLGCRMPAGGICSLDSDVSVDGCPSPVSRTVEDPRRMVDHSTDLREEAAIVIRTLRRYLSPLEYAALVGRSLGRTYAEIAANHGVDAKAVDNARSRARWKLQHAISASPVHVDASNLRKAFMAGVSRANIRDSGKEDHRRRSL